MDSSFSPACRYERGRGKDRKEFLVQLPTFSFDYIVRIYRFEHDKPRSLVGIVEEVGTKGKKAFNTYDELWEILNSSKEGTPIKPFSPHARR